jgi:hypothetical protein
MLKQRMIKVLVGLALLLTVAGSTGIVADAVGLSVTSPAFACQNGGGSGGGC